MGGGRRCVAVISDNGVAFELANQGTVPRDEFCVSMAGGIIRAAYESGRVEIVLYGDGSDLMEKIVEMLGCESRDTGCNIGLALLLLGCHEVGVCAAELSMAHEMIEGGDDEKKIRVKGEQVKGKKNNKKRDK